MHIAFTEFGHGAPSLPQARGRRSRAMIVVFALGGLAAGPRVSQAQFTKPALPITHIDSVRSDGTIKQVMLPPAGAGFGLFAAEDIALGTFRSTGGLRGGFANQGGPVPYNQGGGVIATHWMAANGGYVFFEQGFVMAAGQNAYAKILAVNPAIRFMRGAQGYTFHFWNTTAAPDTRRIGAADGQFGQIFAGVTGAADGSCRDDPNSALANWATQTLVAMKDCPVTWPAAGFLGKRTIADSVWRSTFSTNQNGFRWDDWKIPAARQGDSFLGTQSLFGFMSDYYREQRLRYGNVVPGGSGSPQVDGFPLGVFLRVDGWQFGAPATRNAQFYQVTMINKSADVYGRGVDYDSLYFGLGPGHLMGGAGQYASVYVDIPNSTMYATKANTSDKCTATYPKRYDNTTTSGNILANGCVSTTDKFTRGVYATTWLKSPLGDLRNKLFTNPQSPYYAPSHPLRGDTIMFNHGHPNSFGFISNNWTRSSRAGFGMLSSKEDDYLDGRTGTDFALGTYLSLFRPEDWNGALPTTLADSKFAKFAPTGTINPKTGQPYGSWDYNKDGIPDTIAIVGCGRRGCADVYSDTTAGGYGAEWGNIGNTVSAGPFQLKSNDTTQFLFAFSWTADSLSMRQNIEGIVASYLGNYDGPEPFIFPTVTPGVTYSVSSAALVDSTQGNDGVSTTGASITLRFPQINPVDQYFLRFINKIRTDSINGDATTRRILRLNQGLLAKMTARANDNLAQVLLFKSCDNGQNFTTATGNSATCTAAPTRTVDVGVNAFNWRPITTVAYTGGIPATSTYTETVQAGRSYLYSYVTRSRGFSDIRVVDTTTSGGYAVTDLTSVLRVPTDTISSALSTAGPTVVNIYMPISDVAGKTYARIDTATIGGTATQQVTFAAIGNSIGGTTKMYFANQFIVRKTVDTLTSAATTQIAARWVLPRAATSAAGPAVVNFVSSERVFSANLNIPVRNGTTQITGTLRGTAGSSRVFVDTLVAPTGRPGFVLVDAKSQPISVTNDAYGTAGTPTLAASQQNSPLYPGYVVQLRDSAGTNGFRLIPNLISPLLGTPREFNFVLRKEGDTLVTNARQFVPFVQAITSANRPVRGGRYEINWLTDPWGPASPFKLDPVADVAKTVAGSLDAAVAKATTVTTTSAADVALAGRTLRRARLPFTVTFTNSEGQAQPVRVAAVPRPTAIGNTRLLGTGPDTVRIAVPDSVWLPGDTLLMLHNIERDSVVGTGATAFTVVRTETIDGATVQSPLYIQKDSVGARIAIQCSTTGLGARPSAEQTTCNPLVLLSRGATVAGNQTAETLAGGYLPVAAGWKQVFELSRNLDPRSVLKFTATAFGTDNVVSKKELQKVNVVPNPYLVRSNNDLIGTSNNTTTPQITFTGVPSEGVLRIYSVSGQFLQELTWAKTDLLRSGNDAAYGDLPYNLRTREGLELASGLYLYVLTATGTKGGNQVQSGKFVIIR